MKKNLLIAVLVFFCVLQIRAQSIFQSFTLEWNYENWVVENHSFPEGIYYQYIGKIIQTDSNKSYIHYSIQNVDMTIGYLFGMGIDIEEVWFKKWQSSCGALQVIVDDVLVIRVANNNYNTKLIELGFEHMENPSMGYCANFVKHIKFK